MESWKMIGIVAKSYHLSWNSQIKVYTAQQQEHNADIYTGIQLQMI